MCLTYLEADGMVKPLVTTALDELDLLDENRDPSSIPPNAFRFFSNLACKIVDSLPSQCPEGTNTLFNVLDGYKSLICAHPYFWLPPPTNCEE